MSSDGDLFVTKVEDPQLPDLQYYPLADAYDELELLGFPLCDPFTLVDDPGEVVGALRILKRRLGDKSSITEDLPGNQSLISRLESSFAI